MDIVKALLKSWITRDNPIVRSLLSIEALSSTVTFIALLLYWQGWHHEVWWMSSMLAMLCPIGVIAAFERPEKRDSVRHTRRFASCLICVDIGVLLGYTCAPESVTQSPSGSWMFAWLAVLTLALILLLPSLGRDDPLGMIAVVMLTFGFALVCLIGPLPQSGATATASVFALLVVWGGLMVAVAAIPDGKRGGRWVDGVCLAFFRRSVRRHLFPDDSVMAGLESFDHPERWNVAIRDFLDHRASITRRPLRVLGVLSRVGAMPPLMFALHSLHGIDVATGAVIGLAMLVTSVIIMGCGTVMSVYDRRLQACAARVRRIGETPDAPTHRSVTAVHP